MQDYERSIGVPHPTDNARQQDAELLNVDAMARQLLQKVQQIRPAPQSYIKARLWSSLPIAGWKMMFVPLVLTLVGTVGENFGGKKQSPDKGFGFINNSSGVFGYLASSGISLIAPGGSVCHFCNTFTLLRVRYLVCTILYVYITCILLTGTQLDSIFVLQIPFDRNPRDLHRHHFEVFHSL